PDLLHAPVLDEELEPVAGALGAVAVVAEQAGHAVPDVGGLVGADERAQALRQLPAGGPAAPDPQVEARAGLGVDHADKGDVVDLVDHVETRVAGEGGLVLAREVGELGAADVLVPDLLDRRRRVDDLVGGDPGHRAAQHDAGAVAAGLHGGQAHLVEAAPDLRDVLDPDPVVLDVLTVGDV